MILNGLKCLLVQNLVVAVLQQLLNQLVALLYSGVPSTDGDVTGWHCHKLLNVTKENLHALFIEITVRGPAGVAAGGRRVGAAAQFTDQLLNVSFVVANALQGFRVLKNIVTR